MDAQALYLKAHDAGINAANNAVCQPMAVSYTDRNGNKLTEIVEDGPCGFGMVRIKPARGAFINYLKGADIGFKSSSGGWYMGSPLMTQSFARNAAYARAFAKVLMDAGLNAFAECRYD